MNGSPRSSSRRTFLRRAALLAAAPAIVPVSAFGKGSRPAPSERLTMGMIGLGSMGLRHVKGFLQEPDCQITHACDVDASRRKGAAGIINKAYGNQDCAQVRDFRELIDSKTIDTLCIAVPDHWHSIPAILAVRAGKDVYGEKPLARTIAEGQAMVRAVDRYGTVWQTGSWQRSTAHFRFGCELVRNERIGKLRRVEVGIGVGPKIGPQPVMPVPEGLDYDMWLGPAPWAPYTEKRCHWNFRWILDYSGGQVTDWGGHHIDIAQWGMGTDDTGPVEVVGKGEFPDDGLYDAATHYRFECTYANGLTLVVGSNNFVKQGVHFIGERGWVHITRGRTTASPATILKEKIRPDEVHLARPAGDHRQGHRRDFLDCVKTRARTITPVEIGHRSVTISHLGNMAMLLGRRIRWDPERERILGDATAARMCSRAMREPWHY